MDPLRLYILQELKVEKHYTAGASKAQNGTTALVKGWFSISFSLSDDTHAGVYISTLIIALINTFEIDKFWKKCIINTNTVSFLDASWNNSSAHFCLSDFFPSRTNQVPQETLCCELSASSAFPFIHWMFKRTTVQCDILHFCLAELFNLPYVPVSSTKLNTKSSYLPKTSSYFLQSFGQFLTHT